MPTTIGPSSSSPTACRSSRSNAQRRRSRTTPSGMPVEVDGSSFLRLTMRGGTKQTEDNTSSYDGPLEFHPGFSGLVDLVEGGDFEAQSTWYLGLASEACVRVIRLTDDGAQRLVIDVEH